MDDNTKNTGDQGSTEDTEGYSMHILPSPIGKTDPPEYDPTGLTGNAVGGVKGVPHPMPVPAVIPDPNAGTVPQPEKKDVNS